MKNSHNLSFSKEQLQAINHFKGPALVIAGPGSGKTSVIVNRINYLIQNKNVNPNNILVITFSKMAAMDMQSRFNLCLLSKNEHNQNINVQNEQVQIKQAQIEQVSFGTFHSVFFSIIKSYYGYSSSNIISNSQKRLFISKLLKNLCNETLTDNEYIDSVLRRISYYKNSNYTNDYVDDCQMEYEQFKVLVNQYDLMLQSQRKIDFEDMMLLCRKILIKDSKIREYYQNLFHYILIDEFQDINELQFEIVKLLVGPEQNLFVVGDDDQSIYGFRGSKPEIMLNLQKEYNNLSIVKLSCNYRSTKSIVRLSSVLISENRKRYIKNIYTNNELGSPCLLMNFANVEEENKYIIEVLKEKISSKSSIGILYRTNNRASLLIELLIKNNISFSIKEMPVNPYDTDIYNDFIAYLQISYSKLMPIHLLRKIINKPSRYIDTRLITDCEEPVQRLKYLYKDKKYVVKKLDKLLYDLNSIKSMDMYSAFYYFRKVIGYDEYIYNRYNNDERKLKDKFSTIDDLSKRLKEINTYDELLKCAFSFRDKISEHINSNNNISIMTYHSSKGLEFDTVLIPDINEGIVPNKKAVSLMDIEEERRMFYVACTRAKKEVHLLYLKGIGEEEFIPSRFIDPLCGKDFIKQKRQPD